MNLDKTIDLFNEAHSYNWDYGVTKVKKILKDTNCDFATALVLYWGFQPDYYYQYELSETKGNDKKLYKVIIDLEEKLLAGMYPTIIQYNPSFWLKSKDFSNLKRPIPNVLMNETKGNVSAKDIIDGKIGISSWFRAAKLGNLSLLKKLYQSEILAKEKSINLKDKWKLTAIYHLCNSKQINTFEEVKQCLEFFFANGVNKPKLTIVASSDFAIEKIDFLLKQGVDINSNDYGRNALHFVEDPKVAQYLVDKNIDTMSISKNSETALHGVFKYWKNDTIGIDQVEVAPLCKIILDAGTDPSVRDDSNETALDMARKSKRKDIDKAISLLEQSMM